MGWHTNSMPLPKHVDRSESKNTIRYLNGTDNAELNHYSSNGSSRYFDGLSFHFKIEKKQTPFTVTKPKTIHTGVFTYQSSNLDWIIIVANSKSRCKYDNEYLIDKGSRSLLTDEISLHYDDKFDKLILEGQTLPFLVSTLVVLVNQH